MPELPEVETVVRQLKSVLVGKKLANIEVLREKSFSGDINAVLNRIIVDVLRVAKMIVIRLDEGGHVLVGHLKMTGQLVWRGDESGLSADGLAEKQMVAGGHPTADWLSELPSKHTRVIINFGDGSTLYFNDQRVFGWLRTMREEELERIVAGLPPDVVDDNFTVEYLWQTVTASSRAIKLIILDQKKMGGLGNIYANDALWKARIAPGKPGNELDRRDAELLHWAIRTVIDRAIELNGSSYSHFVDTHGVGGKYQDEFLVYDREGERCRRNGCKGVILKDKLGGRGTYWCSECQK